MRALILSFLPCLLLPSWALSDSVKPIRFGPYVLNHVTLVGSPAGYDYVLTNGYYHFTLGWIEPIYEGAGGLLKETYFETNGDINISPFQSDIGTTFSIKPIRYLEMGLSYNRLLFHNSEVTFTGIPGPNGKELPLQDWRPGNLMDRIGKEAGGADVFTFQGNFTLDMGPAQLFLEGKRELWDIDASKKDFVYEYRSDILIKPRDRINSILAQLTFDLSHLSRSKDFSFTGFAVRDHFWSTARTDLEKNLVSAGITGFRFGRNTESQRRGLDLSLGYWTLHPQLPSQDILKSWMLLADWKWNVQFLKL